ncbi:Uncharacterized conserved protein, DUF58 family, contains vWF domain [Chitinophaga sp. YR573]|uniref:DUF58 domain-containing protein n=1 Tax=Chitinophaga sp. YR573 TaxID=1881040 RepID=UPI0008C879B3|nr:DUF58 domain-containing protein [Chitinophaga sp. YR573]SEW19982.1 Uncharacterized conserved protein, DUF58 family, contains vWF domain [Chitinophaga sp. YR573]
MKKTFFHSLFFTTRFYLILGSTTMLFVLAYFFPALYPIALIIIASLTVLMILDVVFLFVAGASPLIVERIMAQRFSNGDDNNVDIGLVNNYRFPVFVTLLDEIPFQFQLRDFTQKESLKPGETKVLRYVLHPLERGEYEFGNTNAFIRSPLSLAQRRVVVENGQMVKVFPSFIQLHNYELFSINSKMMEMGVHKKRVVGHSMEFDHIKEYVRGDDIRRLNWKATARRGNLMVNSYVEERSQQVYCVIDKGRTMKMPFEGLTLLDYAINASLVFSNIALQKGDKTGLVTLAANQVDVLAASNKKVQLNKILDTLYAQETQWQESDYEKLSVTLRSVFSQRSLLILFTNFESVSGLQRQLPYLRRLAKYHLLLVVFFENTELKKMSQEAVHSTSDIYRQVIAQKFANERKLMVRELTQYGILSLLTPPQQLTMNVVNKYLELKARSLI